MWSVARLSLAVSLWLSTHVSATIFCECENPDHDRVFNGIQQVCDGMRDNGWCPTNCNYSYKNCGYCQFRPFGTGSDADYAKLKSWCSSQTGYKDSIPYKGSEVNCYGYENRVPKSSWWYGCQHENNGVNKRDPSPPELPNHYHVKLKVDLPKPDKWTPNEWIEWQCRALYPGAASDIARTLLVHKQCSVTENMTHGYDGVIVYCPIKEIGEAVGVVQDLKTNCSEIGGGLFRMSIKSVHAPDLPPDEGAPPSASEAHDTPSHRELKRSLHGHRESPPGQGPLPGGRSLRQQPLAAPGLILDATAQVNVSILYEETNATVTAGCAGLEPDAAKGLSDALTTAFSACKADGTSEASIDLACDVAAGGHPTEILDNFELRCAFARGELWAPVVDGDDEDPPTDGGDGTGDEGGGGSPEMKAVRGRVGADVSRPRKASRTGKKTVVLKDDEMTITIWE